MSAEWDPAGIAVFFATIFAIAAFACSAPAQWGLRRIAVGAGGASATIAGMLLSPSSWWWGGVLWSLHQIYLGYSFIVRRRRYSHERIEYVEASVSVLGYIALGNGQIHEKEIAIIRQTYARAGFSHEDLAEIDRIISTCQRRFREGGSDPRRLFELLQSACATVVSSSNQRTRLLFFRAAISLAASDGFFSRWEEQALRATAAWLGITDADVENAWRDAINHGTSAEEQASTRESDDDSGRSSGAQPVVPPDLPTYYATILGISVTASPQEVKRAYRVKAKELHPDVVAHKGPRFAREAEERFKELSKAYAFMSGSRVTT